MIILILEYNTEFQVILSELSRVTHLISDEAEAQNED